VATHNLATGVLAGVLLSGIFFASKVSGLFAVSSELSADGASRVYFVRGEVFFASADRFVEAFDLREVLDSVVIDVSGAHFWDISAVAMLDKVVLKFRREGTETVVRGLNEASATLVDRFGSYDKVGDRDGVSAPAGH